MEESDQPIDVSDGGGKSRKLWFSIGIAFAIVLGGVFYAFVEGFRDGYDVYVTGLLGVLAAYSGANIGNKMVIAKHVANFNANRREDRTENCKNPPSDD